MSLNDINLPANTIADLYRKSLVAAESFHAVIPAGSNPQKQKLSFLGNNKKQVAVLVNYPGSVFIPDNQMLFLTNILSACKLGMDDIALVNFSKAECSYKSLKESTRAKTVLLFGLSASEVSLPVNFPDFQVQHFDETCYLSSPALEDVEQNKEIKKQLWVALKKLFTLN